MNYETWCQVCLKYVLETTSGHNCEGIVKPSHQVKEPDTKLSMSMFATKKDYDEAINQKSPEPSEDGVIWVCSECGIAWNKKELEEKDHKNWCEDKYLFPYVPQSQLTTALEALEKIEKWSEPPIPAYKIPGIFQGINQKCKEALRKIRGEK